MFDTIAAGFLPTLDLDADVPEVVLARALHADQIVAVGNVQRGRLRVRPHRVSNLLGGVAFAVSVGVAWLDLTPGKGPF